MTPVRTCAQLWAPADAGETAGGVSRLVAAGRGVRIDIHDPDDVGLLVAPAGFAAALTCTLACVKRDQ